MTCRWHKKSIFGPGPRVPLDGNGRARFKFLLRAHRSAKRLTADQMKVGEVLESALGDDGRLDLAHAMIAERALCHVATVKRALARLQGLGLVESIGCDASYAVLTPVGGLSRPATPTCCERQPAKRKPRDQSGRKLFPTVGRPVRRTQRPLDPGIGSFAPSASRSRTPRSKEDCS
jgi:hypothetical protein